MGWKAKARSRGHDRVMPLRQNYRAKTPNFDLCTPLKYLHKSLQAKISLKMRIQISFREDNTTFSETLEVTSLGNRLFRLENHPIWSETANYGDVVELIPDADSWSFVRVAQPSKWHHFTGLVSANWLQSPRFGLWLQTLQQRGAFWEVACGGIVFISWPGEFSLDVKVEFEALSDEFDA